MSPFRAKDLGEGIVVVPSCGMDGHAGGFIDYDQSVIFVHDSYRLGGDGRFVAVEGVGDDIAVLDHCRW